MVALDGKTLRRSYDRAEGTSPLHLVSAWAAEQRLVLGQAVEGKSNEITAVPKLLELLSLSGTVVTADAMHCQRQVAQLVREQSTTYWPSRAIREPCAFVSGDPDTPLAQASDSQWPSGL